jgi:cell division protein FtsQ
MTERTEERTQLSRADERSRRAFARRQWRRRWLTWKYVVLAVLLLGVVIGGVWLVLFSQVLAVKQVEVDGAELLPADTVRGAAGELEGEQLARLDLGGVETRIEALAEVRDARVTRHWPDTVLIEIDERDAIAVVEIGGQLRGLDEEGVVFDHYRRAPDDMPRVETSPDAGRDALREAAAVIAALPREISTKVDHVEVATVDQITLVLRDKRQVMWGSAEESELKAQVIDKMLTAVQAPVYDVSVPGNPTVRETLG